LEAILLAHTIDRHDMAVMQPRRRARLEQEAAEVGRVGQALPGQDLQRHVPAQRDLLGLVDHAHPTPADLADDPVVPQLSEGRGPGLRRGRGARRLARQRPVGQRDVLHQGHGREDRADPVGQIRIPLDVLTQRRPLPPALPLEELLGQLEHSRRSRIRF
jgi:hypothetical protein